MARSADSIVIVTANLFKAGPQCFAELDEYVPGECNLDWSSVVRDRTPEEKLTSRDLLRLSDFSPSSEPDCFLTKDVIAFQFQAVGPHVMTGLQCEVDAIGWPEVVGYELPRLVMMARDEVQRKRACFPLGTPQEVAWPVVFMTLWWYSMSNNWEGEYESEFGLLRRFTFDDIKE